MVRALSEDVRSRVLKASSDGISARQAAGRLGIGISTAIRWIGRARIGERTARRQGWRAWFDHDPHETFIVGMIKEQKDITLNEMLRRVYAEANVRIGRSALSVWLRRRGRTFQKRMARPVGKVGCVKLCSVGHKRVRRSGTLALAMRASRVLVLIEYSAWSRCFLNLVSRDAGVRPFRPSASFRQPHLASVTV